MIVDVDEVICADTLRGVFDVVVVRYVVSVVELSAVDIIVEAVDVDVLSAVEFSVVNIALEVVGGFVVACHRS